jgi:predicted dithiol-disulfide oxidoreductase (DUF899 family)
VHLNDDDVLRSVARAAQENPAYSNRMGWTLRRALSFGSDFNLSGTDEQQGEEGIKYIYALNSAAH